MSTVEKTVLYEVVVVMLCDDCDWIGLGVVKKPGCVELYVASGVKLLEKVDNDGAMTFETELVFSEVIVGNIVSASSELLIGGLNEVTGTEDEGGGGDSNDSPDDELLWVTLCEVKEFTTGKVTEDVEYTTDEVLLG